MKVRPSFRLSSVDYSIPADLQMASSCTCFETLTLYLICENWPRQAVADPTLFLCFLSVIAAQLSHCKQNTTTTPLLHDNQLVGWPNCCVRHAEVHWKSVVVV